MNEFGRLFFLILVLTIGLAALFLTASALFPDRVARTQRFIVRSPGRSFWLGLVNFLFFAVIAGVLFSLSEGVAAPLRAILTLPALLISAILVLILSFGWTATANQLGELVFPGQAGWQRTVSGTVLLSFAASVPFAGWFLLLPYTGLTGFGAVVLGFFQKEKI